MSGGRRGTVGRRELLGGLAAAWLAGGEGCASSDGSRAESKITNIAVPPPTSAMAVPPSATASSGEPLRVAAEAEPVRLGVALTLAGPNSVHGLDVRAGLELALDELRHKGEGRKIISAYEDDFDDTSIAPLRVQKLVEEVRSIAVVAGIMSPIAKACAQVANRLHVPVITPTATFSWVTETGDYAFRGCFADDRQGLMAARYVAVELKKKRVALLFADDDEYSKVVAEAFTRRMEELGSKVRTSLHFSKGATDFKREIATLKTTRPDLVFAPLHAQQMVFIAHAAQAAGIPNDLFLGSDGWNAEPLLASLPGARFIDHFGGGAPTSKKFVEAFSAAQNRPPSTVAAMGYDTGRFLVDAVSRAKTLDGEGMRAALAAARNVEGSAGPMSMDEHRNAAKAGVLLEARALAAGGPTWVAMLDV